MNLDFGVSSTYKVRHVGEKRTLESEAEDIDVIVNLSGGTLQQTGSIKVRTLVYRTVVVVVFGGVAFCFVFVYYEDDFKHCPVHFF